MNRGRQRQQKKIYEEHWPQNRLQREAQQGRVFIGTLSVKNSFEAYLRHDRHEDQNDILVEGLENRNRSFHGDVVAVLPFPVLQWRVFVKSFEYYEEEQTGIKTEMDLNNDENEKSDNKATIQELIHNGTDFCRQFFRNFVDSNSNSLQFDERFIRPTGKVVGIQEMKHNRKAIGVLKANKNSNKVADFFPNDRRCPKMKIPSRLWPHGFENRPEDFLHVLFEAEADKWNETALFPLGKLGPRIGNIGDVDVETTALLFECDVAEDLPPRINRRPEIWIPEEEYKKRKDFRPYYCFTIDDDKSKDLDDALSIEDHGDGTYSVGVHISDVSYFVTEDSDLDKVAADRSTSVYLAQKDIPMLPFWLSRDVCSLNPNEDKLTYSIVYTINQDGQVLNVWHGKTVINSNARLNFDQAQAFLDKSETEWNDIDIDIFMPYDSSKLWEKRQIGLRINSLHAIAMKLLEKRTAKGAINLDQVELQFNRDAPPVYRCYAYNCQESNDLVEEFMILTNVTVGKIIQRNFPHLAVLRRQPPPQEQKLENVKSLCESLGLPMDVSSSLTIQQSLNEISARNEHVGLMVSSMIAKSMKGSNYVRAGEVNDDDGYHHYSLNSPVYTNFTSPIRRYGDLLVHRLLKNTYGLTEEQLDRQIEQLNIKKSTANRAQRLSIDMFLTQFIHNTGPLLEIGLVMRVHEKSFFVFIPKYGIEKQVFLNNLPLESQNLTRDGNKSKLEIEWKADRSYPRNSRHILCALSMVTCVLEEDNDLTQWKCTIQRPSQ